MDGKHKMQCSTSEDFTKSHQLLNKNFLNQDKLNYEEERRKSFASWPVHLPVDPNRLAKAGFYYTGVGDEVVCFSCHGHVKNWNYDDVVLKKHADLYPQCDFINDRSTNVPIIKMPTKSKEHSAIIENVDKIIGNISLCNSSVDFTKMKSESERLKSFDRTWPLSYINVNDLVEAGFFYTGVSDKVQCAYCKGIISNWEVGDIPSQEHLKHFPWCDYVPESIVKAKTRLSWYKGSSEDICGNVKKSVSANANHKSSKKRLIDKTQQHTTLEDLGVHLHESPAHPQQSSLAARLRSFAKWPSDVPVSKEDLAEAGFFYIGISDHTKCFHCNGGLCNWEKGDDPWVEHARWFCNCDFLRMTKGNDFIKSCLRRNSSGTLKENTAYPNPQLKSVESLLEKVDKAMNSDLVKNVLDSGLFPPYIVRAAILLQVKETGSAFSNIDDLCIAVSYLKEEMEREPMKLVTAADLNICENFPKNCSISDVFPMPSEEPSSYQQSNGSEGFSNGPEVKSSKVLPEEDMSKDQCLCKICMDKEVGVVFLPCGHLLSCTVCAPALKHCPMCRKAIQATVRAYLN